VSAEARQPTMVYPKLAQPTNRENAPTTKGYLRTSQDNSKRESSLMLRRSTWESYLCGKDARSRRYMHECNIPKRSHVRYTWTLGVSLPSTLTKN